MPSSIFTLSFLFTLFTLSKCADANRAMAFLSSSDNKFVIGDNMNGTVEEEEQEEEFVLHRVAIQLTNLVWNNDNNEKGAAEVVEDNSIAGGGKDGIEGLPMFSGGIASSSESSMLPPGCACQIGQRRLDLASCVAVLLLFSVAIIAVFSLFILTFWLIFQIFNGANSEHQQNERDGYKRMSLLSGIEKV